MLSYWLLFLFPVGVLGANRRLAPGSERFLWAFAWFLFSLAIGLRFEVGGDWIPYLNHFDSIAAMTFGEVLLRDDPGYYLLNWLAAQIGGSIYFVNAVCGMILMAGVLRFVRVQPLPWLGLLIAIPYLIVVVGMGYTRQATALGLVLLGLVSLGNSRQRSFVVWVLLAAAFHKSAVLMLPIAALASTSNRFWSFIWIGVMSLIGGYLFVFDSVETLWINYVEADYQSQGGLIRVLMNAVPAIVFVLCRGRLRLTVSEERLWQWMSILAIICIPLVMMSSTATDRVALYFIPIQIFVFSRFPLLANDPKTRGLLALCVIGYYASIQLVWLVFASHAHLWVPYKNVVWQ
jgi:hypothetical protein